MEISNLTFIVTDDCNFNCSYCFQKKEKKTIESATIERAVDFFYPFLKSNKTNYIGFYGGEPLLAFTQIKHAVLLLQEKNRARVGNKQLAFTVTTNGSLLNEEMLDFFNRYRFGLLLSFDGLTQDTSRKKGTLDHMVRLMKRIGEFPGIEFEINSVFTPRTAADFSASLRFIIEQGGVDVAFNLSTMEHWSPANFDTLEKELAKLTDFLVRFYEEEGTIPVKNFRHPVPGSGIFLCGAGQDKMAVTPGGDIWGCFLFHDYFKNRRDDPQYPDYYFGTLAEFMNNYETRYPEIAAQYADLRQDLFHTSKNWCFLCQDVAGCSVCPVNAAYSSGFLGKVPCRQCKLTRLLWNARQRFHQKLWH